MQLLTIDQAAAPLSDEVGLSTTSEDGLYTTFHLFPKLPAEIRDMIWKESLPQQDELRSFSIAKSEKERRGIYLVAATEYPPISIVCRAARHAAISHLPIALPSVAGHPLRIHPRTTVSLQLNLTTELKEDTGFEAMVDRFKEGEIPSFLVNVHRLEVHLWCFESSMPPDHIWRRIIVACPKLTSVTAFKRSAVSTASRRRNVFSFGNFLALQRHTKVSNAVKPDFWFRKVNVAKKVKIDGISDDGKPVTPNAINHIRVQLEQEWMRAHVVSMRNCLQPPYIWYSGTRDYNYI